MEGVVLNRVGIFSLSFVLNRIRVSDPQQHPYTQTWVFCFAHPLPPPEKILVR